MEDEVVLVIDDGAEELVIDDMEELDVVKLAVADAAELDIAEETLAVELVDEIVMVEEVVAE
jgi:hypothetical protein